MPPKPKFTKDEIVTAAFELARAEGAQALTAREVGRRLGVSSSPIFTVFTDMAELHAAVEGRAEVCFKEYMAMAEDYAPAYKKRGMQWVRFAQDEPMLFRLLFMSARGDALNFDRAQQIIPFGKETDIAIIMRDYHATREQAEHLSARCGYILTACAHCARRRSAVFRMRRSPCSSAKCSRAWCMCCAPAASRRRCSLWKRATLKAHARRLGGSEPVKRISAERRERGGDESAMTEKEKMQRQMNRAPAAMQAGRNLRRYRWNLS